MNIQTLIANLALENESDRSDAAEDLGYTNSAEAIAPLVERLATEPSRKVRETIFLALERIDRPEVIRPVATLLNSDDAFLRNQAIGLLQRKGVAAAPVLLARMRDGDADVRKFVLDTAAGISSPVMEPIFVAAMQDPDVNVRIAALEHVGEHRMVAFRSAAEEIFRKAMEPMLVCAAFATLLQIGDVGSWSIIRRRYPTAASVPTWELGWWIRALGDFGEAGEIGVFHESLRINNGKMAGDTIDALERFLFRHGRVEITEEFWTVLRATLEGNMEHEDKFQLLRVLGGFGAPRSIGDYLVTLLDQSERLTQLGAIEGIKRLDRPDLLARLRDRPGVETDTEVAEALGELLGASE